MGSIKSSGLKKRLISKLIRNTPLPSWVILRTNRRVRTVRHRRHWRRNKLKL
jgi:large subunit ribosomal protein L39e